MNCPLCQLPMTFDCDTYMCLNTSFHINHQANYGKGWWGIALKIDDSFFEIIYDSVNKYTLHMIEGPKDINNKSIHTKTSIPPTTFENAIKYIMKLHKMRVFI